MDALDWTPQMALEHALKFVQSREVDAVIVICLSKGENDSEYNTNFSQSGLCMSEVIALLEIQKARMIVDLAKGTEVVTDQEDDSDDDEGSEW
jgi:hypothetical protein